MTNQDTKKETLVLEQLAEFAHSQWSGWMVYLFSKCIQNDDGTVTIPEQSVIRWKRQMNTEYTDLPDSEKESDRKEARGILDALGNEHN